MCDIGINEFINKNINELTTFVNLFIKSSLNIQNRIIKESDPDICMIMLIRDTYICNLIYCFIGLKLVLEDTPEIIQLDNTMTQYIKKYYSNKQLKEKIIKMQEYYLKKNDEYYKFLNKITQRCAISKQSMELKNSIKITEKKIFNMLNVNPDIKLNKKLFNILPKQFDVKNEIIHLTEQNYNFIINNIDDIQTLHTVENQYIQRTQIVLNEFTKLLIYRHKLALQNNKSTFFEYINCDKHNINTTLKRFLTELNNKIDLKFTNEINKIYQIYIKNYKLQYKTNEISKMQNIDLLKYINTTKYTTVYDVYHIIQVLFNVLSIYFNIDVKRTTLIGWNSNVCVYNFYNKNDDILLGRLYVDITYDTSKKITPPITINISEKMQINTYNTTVSEMALIANYKFVNYDDVILLFREFGYIISCMCYKSNVGMLNYDTEFSNYMPLVMEYFALDTDIIKLICIDDNICAHVEMNKYIDICYKLKIKCIHATFDHIIHNSEKLMESIINSNNNTKILEIYKTVYADLMKPIQHIYNTNVQYIDPLLIIQEINNFQGLLYSNLMNDILAYTTYSLIKKQYVNEFRIIVLDNGIDNYRQLISKFLQYSETDCFTLYVNNIINITDVANDTDKNSFDEYEDSEVIYT